MADAVAALINILPAGPERDELIASLENFQSYLQQHYGWWGYAYRVKAWLATFRDDREGAIAALAEGIDHTLAYTRGIELDLILARWKDDPLFQEQGLRMRQIADNRRNELEAGP